MQTTDAQRNLDEFLDKYGKEGVLILYFTNLLEDIVKGEFLHTIDHDSKNSPGIAEYQDGEGNIASVETLNERAYELRKECESRAVQIVREFDGQGCLQNFDHTAAQDSTIQLEMRRQLKDIFKTMFGVNWGDEA